MFYDAWLSKGGGERRVQFEHEVPLEVGQTFTYEKELYNVTSVGAEPVASDFDAIVFADWTAGPAQARYVDATER